MSNAPPLTITANSLTSVYGATLPTLTASYSGFVNGDSVGSLTPAASLSTTATSSSTLGTYPITASGAVDANYNITYTAGTLTVDAVNSTNLATDIQELQQASPGTPVLSIQVSNDAGAQALIQAANSLTLPAGTSSVTIQVTLAAGTYTDQVVDLPAGVTLNFIGSPGTTVVGNSPALTVESGTVTETGVTFTTATSAPTILVEGGSLTLSNDDIEGSTVAGQPVIRFTGGTLNLGTSGALGHDTLDLKSTGGQFLQTTTATGITAVGDTFEINGVRQTASSLTLSSLTSSLSSSVSGQSVTFTATVTPIGSGTPTGTVTFYDNGAAIGSATLHLVGGVDSAAFTTSSLGVGTDSITVIYGGDSSFTSSTSSVLSQVVNSGSTSTTTTLSASSTTFNFGQPLTLTATVSGSTSGNVDFFDTTTGDDLGSVTLSSSGHASITTTMLPVGSQNITATYSGSGGSSSATVAVTGLTSIYVLSPTAAGRLDVVGECQHPDRRPGGRRFQFNLGHRR